MIAVVDYGAGNIRSVVNALKKVGCEPKVTSLPGDLLAARAVILPGVGAAGDTVTSLEKLGLADTICRYIADERPFLGICIGLQVLLSDTAEGGGHRCLNVIPGKVKRLPPGLKVPHMGWNQVRQKNGHPVFKDIPDDANFYFVHSYYADPTDPKLIAGETSYGISFCSAIARGNLVAAQFHPEKSGEFGLKFYDNFLRLAREQG